MNREILFRGKRFDNGEWAYGYYICKQDPLLPGIDTNVIVTFDENSMSVWNKVDPSTVGQYTGLTDKNGVKIFEGDIVSAKNNICGETYRFLVEFGVCGGVENVEHSVGFQCFFFKEVTGVIPSECMMRKDPVYHLNAYKCEVIGNAYDNPELLEGDKK